MNTFEDQLLDAMYASFLERIKELPTPPPGYFYAPEIVEIRQENGHFVIDANIVCRPIIMNENGRNE